MKPRSEPNGLPVTNSRPPAAGMEPLRLPALSAEPLVSVLLCSYNYADYVGRAIASVLAQTYARFELIVCDDGSSDRSREVIEHYAGSDSRINAIYQPNGGQAAAFNAAYRASSGEVVCLLDSDDAFAPDKLENVLCAFRDHPAGGFSIHRMTRVDAQRTVLGSIPMLYRLPSGWHGARLALGEPSMLPGLPPSSGLSLRREVADRIFPLPRELRLNADAAIQVIAPLLTEVIALERSLAEYCLHGANNSGTRAFAVKRLRSVIGFERAIWDKWKIVIEATEGPCQLPAVKPASVMDYSLARIESAPNVRRLYREAVRTQGFRRMPRLQRWYWRLSALLPDALFRRSLDFVFAQSPLKLMLARWRDRLRNRRNVPAGLSASLPR
jgi:hypothetical protein